MIYYNSNTINDWNFGDDNIIKVYKHGAVCYYKVTSGDTPTPVQEPCFAVVDDITQYQETEFVDVFNKADGKWYKLNNLSQYEEYGIYGDSISSGGTSRLPDGYTEVEYVQNTSSAYLNLNINPTDAIGNSFVIESKLLGEWFSGGGTWEYLISNEQGNASPYYGFGIRLTNGNPEVLASDETNITTGLTLNSDSTSSFTLNVSSASMSNTTPITLFCGLQGSTVWRNGRGKFYSFKLTLNNTLVRDLVPCKRDSDSMVGMYDLANDVFYYPPNYSSYQLVAGSVVTPTAATYYEGKLAIVDGYEYMYSGSSWVNVGKVSGSSITIKSPEYIEKDSSHNGKINLNYVWKTNSKMQFKFYSTNNGGGSMIGEDGMPDNNDCRMFFASTSAYFDWGISRINWSSNGQKNTLYEYEYGNYYIKNMVTSASKTGSTISTSRTNTLYFGLGGTDRFRTYYLKFYDGDTLVKDFIPWTDTNGNFGLYEKLSNTIYSATSGSFTASSVWNDVEVGGGYEYPLEYVVREDPPDNLSFSSMTEAESYECPWVGMTGIISSTDYIFDENYDWVTKYQWTTVSGYICVGNDKYSKIEKQQRNVDDTWTNLGIYSAGTIIESASTDCQISCEYNFCGVDANGNDVIINNGTTTLTQSNWTSPYPVEGIVGDATTTIGMYCFRNIRGALTALTIGNTVTTIEHEAFMETSLLTTLTIPSSVTQIDFWAFTRCNGLNEVIFEGTTPPTFTNKNSGVFHDYCPPVIYVPDSAVSAYRAIDGSVWTNQSWSTNIIQPISNKT